MCMCNCDAGTEIEAESHDRADLQLPANQLQLLKDAIFYSKLLDCSSHCCNNKLILFAGHTGQPNPSFLEFV